MNRIPLLLLPLLAAAPAASSEAMLEARRTITGADLAGHVSVLASDDFAGREPGTPGETKTLDYLVEAFRSLGLAPGAGGSYLQEVPLVQLAVDGDPAFAAGPAGAVEPLTPVEDFVSFFGSPATAVSLGEMPLVFAGHGAVAPEYEWDDYGDAELSGAAVLLLRGEPSSDTDSTLFQGRALTVHGISSTKYEAAAARGARAAVVVHTEASAGYPWTTLAGAGRTQHFLERQDDKPSLELVVHVSEPVARRLLEAAGLDLDELTERAGRPGFTAHDTGLRVSGSRTASRRVIRSHNVVARLDGREAGGEAVVYTAHWDHIGSDPSLEGDTVFNGAVDNATGTAGLLELAQAYASLPRAPRRSVLFVATTAEEKGLLGAEHFAREPLVPLRSIVAVINLDALFPFGSFDAMTVTAHGSSEIEDVLARACRREGRVLQDDSAPEAGAFYRSDHYPFAKRGVPALFAVGGPRNETLVEGSPMLERFMDYLSTGYHKVGDEYDPDTWDMAGIEQDVRIFFETGWRLAEDTRFPNWRFGNEFRRLRDEMRAGRSTR